MSRHCASIKQVLFKCFLIIINIIIVIIMISEASTEDCDTSIKVGFVLIPLQSVMN